ncbi:hypothetical protein QQX98_005273 [Neonectria punicea]|uniref:Uncharacterized protein n=1 Tax=Neonectria punicea TaxID=979145 RepID=A0ABR1H603_9HYPO
MIAIAVTISIFTAITRLVVRMNVHRQSTPPGHGHMARPEPVCGYHTNTRYDDYEDECEAEHEQLRTRRTSFDNTIGTSITGHPSKGGTYSLSGCSAVDLAFLGVDRFSPAQRSADAAEEDAFCARMRQLGARWSGDPRPERPVLYVGWPAGGGVWAVRRSYVSGSPSKGLGRIANAVTMAERCWVIEMLGGTFYADPRECRDLDLDETVGWCEVKKPGDGNAKAGTGEEENDGEDDNSFVLVTPVEMMTIKSP